MKRTEEIIVESLMLIIGAGLIATPIIMILMDKEPGGLAFGAMGGIVLIGAAFGLKSWRKSFE